MLEDHKQLRKLQLEQYKILQSVNDLCSKYGIEYYLLYGTLLGAVRHSKFIPWDYDIDIAMERMQFNRFKSVVQELPDWLEVWDICYSSIEYAGLSRVVKPKDCVFGDIHIDIFIIDNARITSNICTKINGNQRIIAGNAQFTGIAAGRGVGFTTGLLLLRKGLGMRETPIRPHSWHCRMQSGYQYGGNRKRPPVWRRHRGSLRPRGRNLGGVEGMTGGCGSGCDPAIHTRRLRVYHRPRRLRMASRISIFFAARRFEPLNSMG